jgi:hypothetical protein
VIELKNSYASSDDEFEAGVLVAALDLKLLNQEAHFCRVGGKNVCPVQSPFEKPGTVRVY